MPGDEWMECTVEEIKGPGGHSLATGPFGSAISSRFFRDYGVPVIRGSNLSQDVGRRLIDDNLVFVSEEKSKEFRRSIVRDGDLVFTCWGTIDQVGLIDGRCRYPEYVISNKQMKLTPDPAKANSLFLYYLFSTPQMRAVILNQGIGSSVPGFNLGQLRGLRLHLPPVREQQAIACILGALDDKIELNRRMNRTLEAMARAIFQSWFVDFDPVRARLVGQQPPGLKPEIAALFPDAFEQSELGQIPKGWQVKKISEVTFRVTKGDTPRNEAIQSAPESVRMIPMLRVHAITEDGEILMDKAEYIPESIHLGKSKRSILEPNDILYTNAGTIGRVALVHGELLPANTNQAIAIIKPNAAMVPPGFLFMAMRQRAFQAELHKDIVQAVQANLALGKISEAKHVFPNPDDLSRLFFPISQIIDKIGQNRRQSRTLAALRDTLLPTLISGELRVPDAERIVGRCGL